MGEGQPQWRWKLQREDSRGRGGLSSGRRTAAAEVETPTGGGQPRWRWTLQREEDSRDGGGLCSGRRTAAMEVDSAAGGGQRGGGGNSKGRTAAAEVDSPTGGGLSSGRRVGKKETNYREMLPSSLPQKSYLRLLDPPYLRGRKRENTEGSDIDWLPPVCARTGAPRE
nr:uncharacterized protein LOC123480119 [Desmodus rotundus]